LKKDSQSSSNEIKAQVQIKKTDSSNSISKEMNDSFLNPKSENISNLHKLSLKSIEKSQPENEMLDCSEGIDSVFNKTTLTSAESRLKTKMEIVKEEVKEELPVTSASDSEVNNGD